MRRLTRKKLKQDEFVSVVDEMLNWIIDNWKPLAAGLGAVCAIGLLWWGISSWRGGKEEAASYALHQAVVAYQEARAAGTDTAPAREQFEAFLEKYGNTRQADVARIYVAKMDFAEGKVEEAKAALEKVAARHRGDAIGVAATLDLIRLRVASGQASEVVKELQAMAMGTDDRLPPDMALYELARAYEAEHDVEQAREYLQKLTEEFPQSPLLRPAQQKLAELG